MKVACVLTVLVSLLSTAGAYTFGSSSVVDVLRQTSRREALAKAFGISALVGSVAVSPAPAFAGSLSDMVPAVPEPTAPKSRLEAARQERAKATAAAQEACKGTNKCVTRSDQRKSGLSAGSSEM
eukprot:CAMPEP_0171799574 /NCGR_PEP_ID=MMETSP0991-20121206/71188_1 /TAXON_ID=483369 /ORGANISM="non described non described, Strain CCMP2098" /LENGTH=124 /DNA_ID=CAMNT_0012410965 /DNA_START=623 /DNA_END=997 /DNA_ORIENTATION=+